MMQRQADRESSSTSVGMDPGVRILRRGLIVLGLIVLGLFAFGLGCSTPPEESGAEAESEPNSEASEGDETDPSEFMSVPEVVFDPRNPPPGFTTCHRNHCHREGGGVASYQQVMTEIGATRAINVPQARPMPPAPSDVAAVPDDVSRTESGLAMKVLAPGSGDRPTPESTVVIHYTGWTTDGEGFDSSVARGEPTMIPLPRLNIRGLAEAVQLMAPGERRRLWVPPNLAFEGRPGRPQGMVVFDVQLLEVLNQ